MSRDFAPFSLITKKVIKWLQDHVKLHFSCMFIDTCCGQNYAYDSEKFVFYRRRQWQNSIIFVCLFGRPLLIAKCSASTLRFWDVRSISFNSVVNPTTCVGGLLDIKFLYIFLYTSFEQKIFRELIVKKEEGYFILWRHQMLKLYSVGSNWMNEKYGAYRWADLDRGKWKYLEKTLY